MKKPSDWDSTNAFTGETSAQLPKGGYVLKIKAAKVENTDYGERLHLLFDIEEGEYKDYVNTQFTEKKAKSDKPKEVKWPACGRYSQYILKKDSKTNAFFKGLITCIENSNPSYKFDFDENSLVGKLVGGLFAIRQFRGNDGKVINLVEMRQPRSVDVIRSGDYELPADELLSEPQKNYAAAGTPKFEEVEDDEDEDLSLPF